MLRISVTVKWHRIKFADVDFVFHMEWISYVISLANCYSMVECSWNVMARCNAREGKWRGNRRMEWVASTLHTTSEHGISSITGQLKYDGTRWRTGREVKGKLANGVGDLTSLSFAILSILLYFLLCPSLLVLDSSDVSIPRFHIKSIYSSKYFPFKN